MNVIYVDDEKPALDNFCMTVKNFPEIKSLHLFQEAEEALDWVKNNPVDVAFLDMEMRQMGWQNTGLLISYISRYFLLCVY